MFASSLIINLTNALIVVNGGGSERINSKFLSEFGERLLDNSLNAPILDTFKKIKERFSDDNSTYDASMSHQAYFISVPDKSTSNVQSQPRKNTIFELNTEKMQHYITSEIMPTLQDSIIYLSESTLKIDNKSIEVSILMNRRNVKMNRF